MSAAKLDAIRQVRVVPFLTAGDSMAYDQDGRAPHGARG